MPAEATVWTEGKTDWQHLKRAAARLGKDRRVAFNESTDDRGDDWLLKQCEALSRSPQPSIVIFLFDRDTENTIKRAHDPAKGYKSWGNNVYSMVLPIPEHRANQRAVCIEMYYLDDELRTYDEHGRRLFLSSEFNASTGRHLSHPDLSVANSKIVAAAQTEERVRVIESGVFSSIGKNSCLSKQEFAQNVLLDRHPFSTLSSEPFRAVFDLIERIIDENGPRVPLVFGGYDEFLRDLDSVAFPVQVAMVTEACIRIAKAAIMTLAAATVRLHETEISRADTSKSNAKLLRTVLTESFGEPSLTTYLKLARYCYHLTSDSMQPEIALLRSLFAENPLLGNLGDLLDILEQVLPPSPGRLRVSNRRGTKKPVLESILAELARYDGRRGELVQALEVAAVGLEPQVLRGALALVIDVFRPLQTLPFQSRIIEQVRDSNQFDVLVTTYRDGQIEVEEATRSYHDLLDGELETFHLVLQSSPEDQSHDVFPFLRIANDRLHFYTRTGLHGYHYRTVFGQGGELLVPTRRKFSQTALKTAVGSDDQLLFWTDVEPTVSGKNVRANIPFAGDAQKFVGRKQHLDRIMEEIIQIVNRDGIVFGPGGVGKTALLVQLTRSLYEDPPAADQLDNIIWVSAKRDYYDPLFDQVVCRAQQFKTLDNIFAVILAFHGFQSPEEYDQRDRRELAIAALEEGKTLLVLDNFETVAPKDQDEIINFFGVELKHAFRRRPDSVKVIITSREQIPSGFHQISLSGLDEDESFQLMELLFEPYRQVSTAPELTKGQKGDLYQASKGIPLVIKHCFGQIYEWTRPVAAVLQALTNAGSKVVEFSFSEVFVLLGQDAVKLRVMLLLQLGGPMGTRKIADILDRTETEIFDALAKLLSFQCIVRSPAERGERYSVNDTVSVFSKRLTLAHRDVASEIRQRLASLTMEERLEYTSEERDAAVLFRKYVGEGQLLDAEEWIEKALKEAPGSILLNMEFAIFLHEKRGRTQEAVKRLEAIRAKSHDEPVVLRLLLEHCRQLDAPEFEAASAYASTLERVSSAQEDKLALARFYTEWSTDLMLRHEKNPIRNADRQMEYKILAERAMSSLKGLEAVGPLYHKLMAQCLLNRWEYNPALQHIATGIDLLPRDSLELPSYERLRAAIKDRRFRYMDL